MKPLHDDFALTRRDIESYRTKGYAVLRKLFTREFVEHLRASSAAQLAAPSDPYQRGFDRLAYDTCIGNQDVYSLLKDTRFRSLMGRLTGAPLFFTQGATFSLKQRVSSGLAWHIESQSFGYQRADDDAATLWTPLDPIRTSGQRGGMRYVPRSVLCGKFVYAQLAPAMFRYVDARMKQGGLQFDEYVALRDGMLNNEPVRNLLEHHAEEHDFEQGDALLFSKYVVHRSVVLDEGPLETRGAFAFRFISAGSRYDRARALDVEIPRRHYGYAGPTSFHLDVCREDGELIADSPLFAEDRALRLLDVGARQARSARSPIFAARLARQHPRRRHADSLHSLHQELP